VPSLRSSCQDATCQPRFDEEEEHRRKQSTSSNHCQSGSKTSRIVHKGFCRYHVRVSQLQAQLKLESCHGVDLDALPVLTIFLIRKRDLNPPDWPNALIRITNCLNRPSLEDAAARRQPGLLAAGSESAPGPGRGPGAGLQVCCHRDPRTCWRVSVTCNTVQVPYCTAEPPAQVAPVVRLRPMTRI
jgi:hypothetical protein